MASLSVSDDLLAFFTPSRNNCPGIRRHFPSLQDTNPPILMLVLLIEDEPVIVQFIRDVLEQHGHQVLCAGTAGEAVVLCDRHCPAFVLLNLQQEGTAGGMSLARQLSSRFKAKMLFLTGARTQDLQASPEYDPVHKVLYKPFSRKQLWQAFHELTGG